MVRSLAAKDYWKKKKIVIKTLFKLCDKFFLIDLQLIFNRLVMRFTNPKHDFCFL